MRRLPLFAVLLVAVGCGSAGKVSNDDDVSRKAATDAVEQFFTRVHAGDVVVAGAVLGTLAAGHTGCSAPCLHWGVRRERLEYLDPLVLLRPPRVRLLPVPEPWPDP